MIVSLQGSIDQGGGPVQGGVSAARRCAPPRTARLREACQSPKALWHGVGSTPCTSRRHTSREQRITDLSSLSTARLSWAFCCRAALCAVSKRWTSSSVASYPLD